MVVPREANITIIRGGLPNAPRYNRRCFHKVISHAAIRTTAGAAGEYRAGAARGGGRDFDRRPAGGIVSAADAKRVIAVTGASRGIGAEIALELARRGFTVACLTRKGRGPEQTDAQAGSPSLFNVCCDVSDDTSLKNAFAAVVKEAGALHGLVNNAGIHLGAPSHELATAVFNEVMATNASAVFAASREAYPHLLAAGGGIIVNIGSMFDKLGVKRNVPYCASKAAVGAITRCLAVEWAAQNIRVVDVAPGYIATDLNREAMSGGPLAEHLKKRIPSGRTGATSDVAKLVAAIFAEDLPFLTGETLYIDGGQAIAN